MSTHLQAAIDLLVRHAPDELYLDEDHRLHIGSACATSAPRWEPLSRQALLETLHGVPPWVCSCCDDLHAAWADAAAELAYCQGSLARLTADPDEALAHRSDATPRWQDPDVLREPVPSCCMRGPEGLPRAPWSEKFDFLLGQHLHAHMHALATTHGEPTTWVGVPAYRLGPASRSERPSCRLAPLAPFHPWATVTATDGDAGVVLMHLPDTLAELALTHGALRLDPQLVNADAWPVVAALLTPMLDLPSPLPHDFLGSEHERRALAHLPHVLEVAHAATH